MTSFQMNPPPDVHVLAWLFSYEIVILLCLPMAYRGEAEQGLAKGLSIAFSLDRVVNPVPATQKQEQSPAGQPHEICDTQLFEPQCAENEVILMTSAFYGRMKLGKCVEMDLGYLGCKKDVLDIADRKCSGKMNCQVRIPDAEFEQRKPCLKELKTYLQAEYTCIPVVTRKSEECMRTDHVNVSSTSGFLASAVTEMTGCGSGNHPWVITVKPGQRINITLYDFSMERVYRHEHDTANIDVHVCHEYALVQERLTEWNSMVCGGISRVENVYVSKTESVEIHITARDSRYFLLQYEAIGCPDITPPLNGWFERRDPTNAVVGCHHSNILWRVTCSGTTWLGDVIGNCSAPTGPAHDPKARHGLAIPLGASVAIIIGAALLVGIMVVFVGLVRYRSKHSSPMRETIPLREKPPQSLEIVPDSGRCSMETHIENEAGGHPRVIRHHRTIKINGNEYAHIWESPLPEPRCGPSCRGEHNHYRTVYRADELSKQSPYLFRPPQMGQSHPQGATAQAQPEERDRLYDAAKHLGAGRRNTRYPQSETPRYSTLDRERGKGGFSNSSSV